MSGGSGTGGTPAYLDLDQLEDALIALLERPKVVAALADALAVCVVTHAHLGAALTDERQRLAKGVVAHLADRLRRGDEVPGR